MKRVDTASPDGADLASNENEKEDRTVGCMAAAVVNDLSTSKAKGIDERVWVSVGAVANNGFPKIDNSIDWRDRLLSVRFLVLDAANSRPGQSTDYKLHEGTGGVTGAFNVVGFTGAGANSNTTTGAAVDGSNPPAQGASTHPSWAVNLDPANPTDWYLYADPTDGALYFYNKSGGAAQVIIWVRATGPLGKRS